MGSSLKAHYVHHSPQFSDELRLVRGKLFHEKEVYRKKPAMSPRLANSFIERARETHLESQKNIPGKECYLAWIKSHRLQ